MSSSRLERLLKFLEEDPTDPFNHYAVALEYASMRNIPSAIAKLQELVIMSPSYVPAYQQLGGILRDEGEVERAREVLRRGIEVASALNEHHARDEMQNMLDEIIGPHKSS